VLEVRTPGEAMCKLAIILSTWLESSDQDWMVKFKLKTI